MRTKEIDRRRDGERARYRLKETDKRVGKRERESKNERERARETESERTKERGRKRERET